MRLWTIFLKTWREFLRDPWVLGLTLAFAPFFVFLYWLWFQGGPTAYTILLLDHDRGEAAIGAAEAIRRAQYSDDKPLLRLHPVSDRAELEVLLHERSGTAFIELPADFSRKIAALHAGEEPGSIRLAFGGDLTNPYYPVASILALNAIDTYVQQATGRAPMIVYIEEPLGASGTRTEFETYVPGVLIFAVIMLIFIAAMAAAREVESGALRRLKLTPVSAFDLLGGISLALVVIGVAAVLLTLAAAAALGFQSRGPLWVAALVGALTSLAVIGMGMLVAAFTGTVSQAFVVANFPLGLLMFFSGAIFPLPKVVLFTLGGREVGLYDILPPTHAVAALNKVLTLGAGLSEVTYELGMLVLLSALYFALGVGVFGRKRLRSG